MDSNLQQLDQNNQHLTHAAISAIELQGIRVRYSDAGPPVLDIENLVIHPGERTALIGPSGAAKTTLLRLINGYVQPEAGQVSVLGQPINRSKTSRRRVGIRFSRF